MHGAAAPVIRRFKMQSRPDILMLHDSGASALGKTDPAWLGKSDPRRGEQH